MSIEPYFISLFLIDPSRNPIYINRVRNKVFNVDISSYKIDYVKLIRSGEYDIQYKVALIDTNNSTLANAFSNSGEMV